MMISPCFFFQFFKVLIFWIFMGVKGKKMVQNEKKLLSLFISQEPYIRLSFMVHLCKMIITPRGFFSFFQNFDFLGVKGQKMVQNQKKLCLLCSISQEPYVLTKTQNRPKQPEASQNDLKQAKTSQNDPKPAETTHEKLQNNP